MRKYRYLKIGVSAAVIIIAFGVIFCSGVFVGFNNRPAIEKVTELLNKETKKPASVDFSPFWEAWKIIEEKYMADGGAEQEITDEEKVWGAISGLVGALGDPYSAFLPPEENKLLNEEISGHFGGVGIEIEKRRDSLIVVTPLAGTPAYKAGIAANDEIIALDGKSVEKMSLLEVINTIRGPIGTKIILSVMRDTVAEPLEFNLTRAVIDLPVLESKLLMPQKVFLIKLHNFTVPTPILFRQAIGEWLKAGTNKLIIDVRSNPGGLLDAAVDTASWFLPSGTPIAYENKRNGGGDKVYRSRGYHLVLPKNHRIVILVDEGSASAAEIFAAALAEHGQAILVGEKTFGKGSVQELIPLSSDTTLKLTVARWLTPQGISLSENGLVPQIIVSSTDEDRRAGRDPQLEKALVLLQ